jgi:integrase
MARNPRAKPHHDFPLFMHATGQWAKKVRGRMFYFGKDPKAALARWLAEKDALLAGHDPRREVDTLTVRDLANEFLTAKKLLLDQDAITLRSWRDYYLCCERLLKLITGGGGAYVAALQPADFDRLRAALATTLGPVSLGNEINRLRGVFKFAWDARLVAAPVHFGQSFRRPARKLIRKARAAAGPRMFAADEIRRLLDLAAPPVKAMILLGINCGFGQTDCAQLPRRDIDLAGGWVDHPRPKTGVDRRCPLWPETVAALRVVVGDQVRGGKARRVRASAREREGGAAVAGGGAGLVFLTQQGRPWVRSESHEGEVDHKGRPRVPVMIDGIGLEFGKLLRATGIARPGLGFYALRHTFQTVAEKSRDSVAVGAIMGHVDASMAGAYREGIDDDRLREVVGVVRAWLWPGLPRPAV